MSFADPIAIVLLAVALLVPALINRFPLIFPDSGTYLGIAFGAEYAIDRSSWYGLLLKPLAGLMPGIDGLWLMIAAQAALVAAILWGAARSIVPARGAAFGALLLLTAFSALPWHAGQFMPDAFTGPLVLLAVLASLRDPAEDGAALLWCGAIVLATTHYTHLILLGVAGIAAIGAQAALGAGARAILRRLTALLLALALVIGALVAANGIALKRWSVSPAGSLFLFARLNEDGLIAPWIARHCGRDAPAELCAAYPGLPRDSQTLLWGGTASPITATMWGRDDETRWRWAEMLGTANRGAIGAAPGAFLASATQGAAAQFATFQAIDDECPRGCGDPTGGITRTLARYRPDTLAAHLDSGQNRDTTPKRLIRAITTPIAALALLLLAPATLLAWRRRDRVALAFLGAIGATLLANAALAGALSDVHDRYQSRIVWLAPAIILLLALRWRAKPCPRRSADA